LLHPWFQLAGTTAFALRFFSLAFGVLSVAVTYQLGQQMIGRSAGLGWSLLMATSPYLVWYAQDGKMYSLLLFLSIASVLALFRACQERSWQAWGLYFLVTWLSWYVHILAVLLLPFHFVVWFVHNRRTPSRREILTGTTILSLLYLPLLYWQLPVWLSPFTTGHHFYDLPEIIRTQLFMLSIGYPTSLQFVTALLFSFLFPSGIYHSSKPPQTIVLLATYFTLPVLAIYFVSLGMPIYTDRYLITIAPPFYALCAVGLIALHKRWLIAAAGLLLLLIALSSLTIYIQANTIVKPVAAMEQTSIIPLVFRE